MKYKGSKSVASVTDGHRVQKAMSSGFEGIDVPSGPAGIFGSNSNSNSNSNGGHGLFGSDDESGGFEGIDVPSGPAGIFASDNNQLRPQDYDARELFGSDDESEGIEGIDVPSGPAGIFGSSSNLNSNSNGGHGLFGSDDESESEGIEGIDIPDGPAGIFGSSSSSSSSSSGSGSGGHGLFGSDYKGKTTGLGDEKTTKYSAQYKDRTLAERIKEIKQIQGKLKTLKSKAESMFTAYIASQNHLTPSEKSMMIAAYNKVMPKVYEDPSSGSYAYGKMANVIKSIKYQENKSWIHNRQETQRFNDVLLPTLKVALKQLDTIKGHPTMFETYEP